MRIDAHQHFWHYQPETHGWISDEMRVLRKDFTPKELKTVLRWETTSLENVLVIRGYYICKSNYKMKN